MLGDKLEVIRIFGGPRGGCDGGEYWGQTVMRPKSATYAFGLSPAEAGNPCRFWSRGGVGFQ